jgi:hypothetical protein
MRQTIYRHDDILTFNVIDTSQRNGTWYGKELGAVRPKLDWHTTQVGKLPTL